MTIAGVMPFARADVALPGGEPVEGLERRAVGGPFEAPPVGFDGREIVMDRKADRRGLERRASLRARSGAARSLSRA